ncbi:hypothetical protein [Pseudobutyrivibrio xylanivorans]|uniref:ABC-2 family transporter protein n=1 Tax=Pseudobutyrivibrio xylanivorans TaxID=185007 RepID=A0A1G5RQL0_PSEXY|nr:hypothetical protein [Pseudobutyrivibrio xylanivorans]SCZ76385.1 hypothetical protein SAMN02910350_00226 [Pseudobutyrivibrio xylanivorans]
MSRDIRATAQLKKYSELYNLYIIIGVLILDVVLYIVFRATGVSEGTSAGEFISMMYGITVGILCSALVFVKMFMMVDEVSRGLCFGMTRRELFICMRIVDLLEIIVIAVTSTLVLRSVDASLIFKIALLVYGIIMVIEGLAGNNIIRYGKAAYWVFYIAFLCFFLGGSRLIGVIPGGEAFVEDLIEMFINPAYNQGVLWAKILGFNAFGLLINWLTFRTISVKTNV